MGEQLEKKTLASLEESSDTYSVTLAKSLTEWLAKKIKK